MKIKKYLKILKKSQVPVQILIKFCAASLYLKQAPLHEFLEPFLFNLTSIKFLGTPCLMLSLTIVMLLDPLIISVYLVNLVMFQ